MTALVGSAVLVFRGPVKAVAAVSLVAVALLS